jgi:hypothetical protein
MAGRPGAAMRGSCGAAVALGQALSDAYADGARYLADAVRADAVLEL